MFHSSLSRPDQKGLVVQFPMWVIPPSRARVHRGPEARGEACIASGKCLHIQKLFPGSNGSPTHVNSQRWRNNTCLQWEGLGSGLSTPVFRWRRSGPNGFSGGWKKSKTTSQHHPGWFLDPPFQMYFAIQSPPRLRSVVVGCIVCRFGTSFFFQYFSRSSVYHTRDEPRDKATVEPKADRAWNVEFVSDTSV